VGGWTTLDTVRSSAAQVAFYPCRYVSCGSARVGFAPKATVGHYHATRREGIAIVKEWFGQFCAAVAPVAMCSRRGDDLRDRYAGGMWSHRAETTAVISANAASA